MRRSSSWLPILAGSLGITALMGCVPENGTPATASGGNVAESTPPPLASSLTATTGEGQPTPAAPPVIRAIPAPTEQPEAKALPGLMPVDVYLSFTDKGFRLEKTFGDGYVRWECSQETNDYEYTVTAWGNGPGDVTKVEAVAIVYDFSKLNATARQFFGYVATIPYDGSTPNVARQWVEANIGKSTSATFGPASFEISASAPGARILEIKAK